MRCVLAIILLCHFFPSAQAYAQPPTQGRERLVYGVFSAASPTDNKYAYGNSFVVARRGMLVTSYHVVRPSVLMPADIHVYVEFHGGSVEAIILAVDVVHDLAVILVDRTFLNEFHFSSRKLRASETLNMVTSSLDNDVPETNPATAKVEGVRRLGMFEQIALASQSFSHIDGAPLLNQAGEVAGIVMSFQRGGKLTFFGVPSNYIYLLVESINNRAPALADWQPVLIAQLAASADAITKEWLDSKQPAQDFNGWKIPVLGAPRKCWTEKVAHELGTESQKCFSTMTAMPEPEVYMGTLQMSVTHAPGAGKLWSVLMGHLEEIYYASGSEIFGDFFLANSRQDRGKMTRNECGGQLVVNQNGVQLRVEFCAAAYRAYGGLVDAVVKIASVEKDALIVAVRMNGFRSEHVSSLVQKLVEGIERH